MASLMRMPLLILIAAHFSTQVYSTPEPTPLYNHTFDLLNATGDYRLMEDIYLNTSGRDP